MKDPICGMKVAEPPKIRLEREGMVYGFCSERCRSAFESGQAPRPMDTATPSFKGYFILAAVFAFIAAFVYLRRSVAGDWSAYEAMADLMGAFFVIFGCFKMLDLRSFADAYQTYDLIAAKSRRYAMSYPLIQIVLGSSYLSRTMMTVTSAVSLVLMSVSAIGVARALFSRKKIRCACLGTKIQLPMTTVSLLEDSLMALMAVWMLFGHT